MSTFHLEPSEVSLINDFNRHTASKTSFVYILIDPRVCDDLFSQVGVIQFEKFLKSIFYVGKGSANRPIKHIWDAAHALNTGNRNVSNLDKYR